MYLYYMLFYFSTQALIYPLTVASKSASSARHNAANQILKNMCEHSQQLVQQAVMVRIDHVWTQPSVSAAVVVFTGIHPQLGPSLFPNSMPASYYVSGNGI